MSEYGIILNDFDGAIEDLRNGKPVILLDHPDREGEGDFIFPARMATPALINQMLHVARGAFIAVFMPESVANDLRLPPQMPPEMNQESRKTNFRLTCDTKYGKSGCSALERAQTVNILGKRFVPYSHPLFRGQDPHPRESTHLDLVRPGHVVPIVVHPHGLRGRQGHTEGGIELMRLAGIEPAVAVDMEILHADGSMAKADYLRETADKLGLKLISIGQICERLGVQHGHARIA